MNKRTSRETVKLDRLVPGGQSIGTLADGKKAFVWGALPGEVVEFEITKSKKSYVEGIVKKVISNSSHRIEPKDDCYLSTSPWQTMNYDYELEQKSELICEAFRQQGVKINKPSMITDNKQFGYRNKMEYSLYWDNDEDVIKLAFRKRGTHTKLPIESSSIEREEILEEAKRIIADLNARGEQARKYQSLLVRCDQSGQVSSALFENYKPRPKMQPLTDKLLDFEYSYSPNGFFQINLPVYEMVLSKVKESISTDKVVDMYAGVGTIGLSVARDKDLTLVEVDGSAFAELAKNTEQLKTVKAVHSSTEGALDHIVSDATIIVDPPRAGLHESVVQKLSQALPPVIIYLSCNPITQARDIAPLLSKYKIELMQGYNFFPRTPHIENLVTLKRN